MLKESKQKLYQVIDSYSQFFSYFPTQEQIDMIGKYEIVEEEQHIKMIIEGGLLRFLTKYSFEIVEDIDDMGLVVFFVWSTAYRGSCEGFTLIEAMVNAAFKILEKEKNI